MTPARRLLRTFALPLLLAQLAACGRDAAPPSPAAERAAASGPSASTPEKGAAPAEAPRRAELVLPTLAPADVPQALARAEAQLAAGQLERTSPDAPGALETYLAVLAVAPTDATARTGVERSLDALLERGRIAMRLGELREAERIAALAQRALPGHRDLPGYGEQLRNATAALAEVGAADAAARAGRFSGSHDNAAPAALRRALALLPGFAPAVKSRDHWLADRLERAWKAAAADQYDAADARLAEGAALHVDSPQLLVMRLRIAERRQARTQALLGAGDAAVERLDLEAAEKQLEAARAIAAQASGTDRLRERIFLARHYGHFAPGRVLADRLAAGGHGPELVVVPFGEFTMGKDDERWPHEGPERTVAFARGFAIGRNEVTVADFRRFVAATGYKTRATREGRAVVFDERGGSFAEHEGVDWRRDFLGRDAADDRPVVHVTFGDAQKYADWLSQQTGAHYRLPTEAEWEYVLRAGQRAEYPWGDADAPPKGAGNLSGEGDKSSVGRSWGTPIRGYTDFFWGPAPVRSFRRGRWGTYDLVGNVSEWTLDCWHDSYRRAPLDGSAWVNPGCPQRVVRGASWASSLEQARSAARMSVEAKSTQPWLGFRVVREI